MQATEDTVPEEAVPVATVAMQETVAMLLG
jgi:hypothetical protein